MMKTNHWLLLLAAAWFAVASLGCAGTSDQETEKPQQTTPTTTPPTEAKPSTEATTVEFKNEKGEYVCPVTGDLIANKTDETMHVDHAGKRYYFCCAACEPTFKADPDKYADGKAIASGEATKMGH